MFFAHLTNCSRAKMTNKNVNGDKRKYDGVVGQFDFGPGTRTKPRSL